MIDFVIGIFGFVLITGMFWNNILETYEEGGLSNAIFFVIVLLLFFGMMFWAVTL